MVAGLLVMLLLVLDLAHVNAGSSLTPQPPLAQSQNIGQVSNLQDEEKM